MQCGRYSEEEISVESLYSICIERVNYLLRRDTWNTCSINPFSYLPSGIVDDLMENAEPYSPEASEVLLLLKSGLLTQLHLHSYKLLKQRDLFLNLISTNCFRHLRVLTWHSCDDKHIPLVETLISSCSKLEEFRSSKFVSFEVFQNCEELRALSFEVNPLVCDFVTSRVNMSVLASLRNLQVFSTSHMNSDVIATVLKYCPQLLFLGHNDSLDGLEKIHAINCASNCSEISPHFQLTKCIWGKHTEKFNSETFDIVAYKSKFPEKVRIAVSLCPFVEELIIYINHTDSIESLKNLKQLTHLKISFHECEDEYVTNFLALLKVIGPKLKFLSVDAAHPVPIDIICEYCPHLEAIELARFATVSGSDWPQCNYFLKSLRIMKIDQKALLFLLSRCKNLMELSLCDAVCLDDGILSRILRLNPLTELKICEINESSLSRRGFRMILETASSLRRVNFAIFRPDIASVIESLIKELNLTNVIFGDMFDIPYGGLGIVTSFFHS